MSDSTVQLDPASAPPVDGLAQIAVTPTNHFRLHFCAAVYHLLHYLRLVGADKEDRLRGALRKYPVFEDYLADTLGLMPEALSWREGPDWWAERIGHWEGRATTHLPLRDLAAHAGLSKAHITAFMIVGLVEEDSRFGTVIADLQAPVNARRPTLELVGRIVRGEDVERDPWSVCRPLVRCGLVDAVNRDAPRSEKVLHVPEVLWDAARGEVQPDAAGWYTYEAVSSASDVDTLVVPETLRRQARRTSALVRDGRVGAVIVRGSRGSDRQMVIAAVARELGRGIVTVQSPALAEHGPCLGPLSTMMGCLPVVVYDLNPGETVDAPVLRGYDGAVGFLVGFEGGVRGPVVERALTLRLPPLNARDRREQWQRILDDEHVEDLDAITERFHLPGGHIRRVAAGALAHAGLDGREQVTPRDVQQACRSLNRQLLDTLADRIEAEDSWSNLVVNDTAHIKLHELQQRCRHRERVLDHLGPAFGSSANRGVRSLFSGPSGTGKTLAAKIIAAELGLDLYRVDLAAVVNKYIGETEKNLHRVFSVAEELDVILLLDEGDALLGGRTEVRSAHDRYANLETNYLLQRLEHYQGIVLITTNLCENIDRAFERRMDVVVEFLPPQPEQRLAIWRLHLPVDHAVADDELHDVALRCALTGGQIRNAAMQSVLLSLDAGDVVRRHHVEQAVRSEYRKSGGTCPLTDGQVPAVRRVDGVEAFFSDRPT